ncbi:transposase [Streptomyces sp. IB201691-2A2]|uniref:transposase n=1 Tax=Streptomyces sp. IB201691-2A2 TaxID=2561920 RepID=UPI0021B0B9BB|nr:transposase [Streptomyces sp. IB201691-2A2]
MYGNVADRPELQRWYPTDMTDAEWAEVRALLPVPGWMRGRGGWPEGYCHRALLDAIRYLVDNGVKWRAMPADFPPWDRTYAFFRRWRDHAWSERSMTGCVPGSASGWAGTRSRRPA